MFQLVQYIISFCSRSWGTN